MLSEEARASPTFGIVPTNGLSFMQSAVFGTDPYRVGLFFTFMEPVVGEEELEPTYKHCTLKNENAGCFSA